MSHAPSPSLIAAAVADRHRQLSERLLSLTDEELLAPSSLPGWSRLTVVCHLRYGAKANLRVTEGMLAGRESSYYPQGRAVQRDATLQPGQGEQPQDAVASLVESCAALDQRWQDLGPEDWSLLLEEPQHNRDLGPVSLLHLAGLRLTEAEVHGTDLAIGLADWSDVFVSMALPQRLRWLPKRRSNHGPADRSIRASWLLRNSDRTSDRTSDRNSDGSSESDNGGPSFLVAVDGDEVMVTELEGLDGPGEVVGPGADAVISGSGRLLLGFILGRVPLVELHVAGDRSIAERFLLAFPSP